MDPNSNSPERDDTDGSLHAERLRTDAAVTESTQAIAAESDEVLGRAREHADVILQVARSKADAELAAAGLDPGRAQASVDRGRAREDDVLEDERATADETLARERATQLRVLSRLLPLERRKTDEDLLTERARSDERLAQRDDFLGMVSHDLRGLLCTVLMKVSRMASKAPDSSEGRRLVADLNVLETYLARMNSLSSDLIDVVRIDSGKLALNRQPSDAVDLVSQTVESFSPLARDKGLSLSRQTPGPLLAHFDAHRLLQVLSNLVDNAIKFTPAGGHVIIRGERDEVGLRISVLDTGAGIPPDRLEAVFNRFWQADKDDKRGLGLGLYISRFIVEAHGGTLSATSTLGQGSSFVFTIPSAGTPGVA